MTTENGTPITDVAVLADEMKERLTDIEGLRVVGYYSPDDTGTVFVREDVQRHFTEQELTTSLEDAVLESISVDVFEDYFDDELVGTIRQFKEKAIIYCCVADLHGVVVAVDRGVERDYQDILAMCERVVHNN